MTKEQYLLKLESLLKDISEFERNDALRYYQDFLDSAVDVDKAISDLGSPESVAKEIKESIADNSADFQSSSSYDGRDKDEELFKKFNPNNLNKNRRRTLLGLILFALIILIAGGTLSSFFITALLGLLSVLLVSLFGSILGIVAVVYFFTNAILAFNSSVSYSLLLFGIGLILIGITYLIFAFNAVLFKSIPNLLRWCIDVLRKLFQRLVGEPNENF